MSKRNSRSAPEAFCLSKKTPTFRSSGTQGPGFTQRSSWGIFSRSTPKGGSSVWYAYISTFGYEYFIVEVPNVGYQLVIEAVPALISGEAGKALGDRALKISENAHSRRFEGTLSDWGNFGLAIVGEFIGGTKIAESEAGYDAIDGRKLSTEERIVRGTQGALEFTGTTLGAASAGATATRYLSSVTRLKALRVKIKARTASSQEYKLYRRIQRTMAQDARKAAAANAAATARRSGKRGTSASNLIDQNTAPKRELLANRSAIIQTRSGELTRSQIIDGISGLTRQGDEIAAAIRSGDLELSVLSDDMFRLAWRLKGGSGKAPQAFVYGEQLFVRRNAQNILSEVVHEGTHGLDWLRDFNGTVHQLEKRAYFFERQFQIAGGGHIEFYRLDKMLEFILREY